MVIKTFNLEIDLSRRLVFRDGATVNLTATEFKLLAYLANHAGRVLTHRSLLEQVWGFEYIDNIEYLRVYMSQLRHKLEDNPKAPRILLSEPGVGYRFVVDL
jgi:two-component system, OmpR family, KDP operon response regulator KdpE